MSNGAGEACCLEAGLVACGGSTDSGVLSVQECRPAATGRTPCQTAEICSDADRTCRRKGSSCVVDPTTGMGSCQVPRPIPKCASPCPEGLSCVATKLGGPAECSVKTFECERGNQCAPDEACFALSHQCGLGSLAVPGSDRALCVDATDCSGYCGGKDLAFCRKDPGAEDGACECVPRCRRDQDCRGHVDCAALGVARFGAPTLLTTPFCDRAHGRCDCK